MHAIVLELTIAAPPDQVYEAIAGQQGPCGWWTTECKVATEVGATSSFRFPDDMVFEMRVDQLDPPELLHWTCIAGPDEWVDTQIAFRIEGVDPDDDDAPEGASTLRFWHGGWEYEDGLLPRSSFQWAMYLDSLRRYLETGAGSPA